MKSTIASFAKGVGTGALIGIAAFAGTSALMNGNFRKLNGRTMKKRLSHAAKNAGCIMENVSSMLR